MVGRLGKTLGRNTLISFWVKLLGKPIGYDTFGKASRSQMFRIVRNAQPRLPRGELHCSNLSFSPSLFYDQVFDSCGRSIDVFFIEWLRNPNLEATLELILPPSPGFRLTLISRYIVGAANCAAFSTRCV